jgi:hypothetical protein
MEKQHDIWDELESATGPDSLEEEMFYLISAYADGECSPKEKRLVEAYLSENPEARDMLAEIRAQAAMLAAETAEPPGWLREAIFNSTTRRRTLLRGLGVPRLAALAGCAAAVALAAVYWPKASEKEIDQPEVVAVAEPSSIDRGVSPSTVSPLIGNVTEGAPVVVDVIPEPRRRDVAQVAQRKPNSPGSVVPATSLGSQNANQGQMPIGGSSSSATSPVVSSAPVRMGPEQPPTGRVVPDQPDVVAMAGLSFEQDESPVSDVRQPEQKRPATASDPREDLRRRLQAVNRDNDVQDAFRGGR